MGKSTMEGGTVAKSSAYVSIWQRWFAQFDALDSLGITSYQTRVWKHEILVHARLWNIHSLWLAEKLSVTNVASVGCVFITSTKHQFI